MSSSSNMLRVWGASLIAGLVTTGTARAADPSSGPDKGAKVPELKVADVTGEHSGKDVDYADLRKEKPTVFFVVKDWDRPVARLLKTLDDKVKETAEGAYIVGVWLSADQDATKEYLPKAQQSLKLENTALTVSKGGQTLPAEWGINADARITVVVAVKGKVVKSFGYDSVNDTVAREILSTLKDGAK